MEVRRSQTGGMSEADFLDLVAKGESDKIEFKVDIKHVESIVRDIVAFANARGGTILCGVGDGGELIGLSDGAVNRLAGSMTSVFRVVPVDARIDVLRIGSRKFVAISVSEVPDSLKPVMTAHGQAYIRVGASVVRMPEFNGAPSESPGKATETLRMFVAMCFRFEEEPVLVDYFEAIRRATEASGLPVELIRMDQEEGDYEITTEIINRICECDIVLADFTFNSPNVYFEAGVAVGAKKRMIRTARKDTVMAFDIKTHKILLYANATQLENGLPGKIKDAYDFVIQERKLASHEK